MLMFRKMILTGAIVCTAVFVFAVAFASDEVVIGSQETTTSGEWISPLPEVSLYIRSVGRSGITTVTRTITDRQFPNYDLGSPAYVYRVDTTADIGGRITICIWYDWENRFPGAEERSTRIIQLDGEQVSLITHSYDYTSSCGDTDHLSSFAMAQNFGVWPTLFTQEEVGKALVSEGAVADLLPENISHTKKISFSSMAGAAELRIDNGVIPTTGAQVWLNGKPAGGGALFKRNQNNLFSSVQLLAGSNVLEVSVDGPLQSWFILSIQRPQQ